MKSKTYTVRGTTPLMMHNERLANPFDEITKAMKAVTGKRKKTEDDLLEIARLEWLGGLYHDPSFGIHMPGYNILSAIVSGGKLHKLGTAVKRSVLVEEDMVRIAYKGPANPEELFADKAFVDVRGVKVGTAKVMRCRPIFKDWAMTFTVLFDESSIQAEEVERCLIDSGRMCGLGDYRPRFGRFEVLQ